MKYEDLVKLDYGIAMIDVDGFVCVIANKWATQSMELKTDDILKIKWLGTLKIVGVIRKPYRNALNQNVQEVKFICKKVV